MIQLSKLTYNEVLETLIGTGLWSEYFELEHIGKDESYWCYSDSNLIAHLRIHHPKLFCFQSKMTLKQIFLPPKTQRNDPYAGVELTVLKKIGHPVSLEMHDYKRNSHTIENLYRISWGMPA